LFLLLEDLLILLLLALVVQLEHLLLELILQLEVMEVPEELHRLDLQHSSVQQEEQEPYRRFLLGLLVA
jgi:phosphoenolpyruvate carboxylase